MENYYKTDVCDGGGGCKLYNPLLTQGQCKYLNEWYEQKEEIEILKKELIKECEEHKQAMLYADKRIKVLEKALELACDEIRKHLLRCDTKNERINKHNLGCVEKTFLEEARKELDNEKSI